MHSIYVVSLKYSPVFKTLSFAFGEEASRATHRDVHYLFSQNYRWLVADNHATDKIHYVTTSHNVPSQIRDCLKFLLGGWIGFYRLFRENRPSVVFFSNPHPLNPFLAILARRTSQDVRVISHIHEPDIYKGVYALGHTIYTRIVMAVQNWMIHLSNDVVVSSEFAKAIFEENFPWYRGQLRLVPLLFEDYQCTEALPRKYISYVGTVGHHGKHRGIDIFLNLLKHCVQSASEIEFQIVTKDDISTYTSDLTHEELSALHIINKPKISDAEISKALKQSIVCLLLYDYPVKQSGVIPVAYMNGTPVIATEVGGLTESVRTGQTGYLVPSNPQIEEMLRLIGEIKDKQASFSISSRQMFEKTHHMHNWQRYYSWLIQD